MTVYIWNLMDIIQLETPIIFERNPFCTAIHYRPVNTNWDLHDFNSCCFVHLSGCSCRTSLLVPEHSLTRRPRLSSPLVTVMVMARSESMVWILSLSSISLNAAEHIDIFISFWWLLTADSKLICTTVKLLTSIHIFQKVNICKDIWSETESNLTRTYHHNDIRIWIHFVHY